MGCSGWSYGSWVGNFYPRGMKTAEFLRYYSRIFDAVEIDSSFYGIPDASRIDSWERATREGFYFCPKVPGEITHKNHLKDSNVIFLKFLGNIKSLNTKLGPILLQFPPRFNYDDGRGSFIDFIEDIPKEIRLAVEFRDKSWFNESVYKIMQDHHFITVWSETPFVNTISPVTSDEIYLRLVGDRNLPEEKFGKILRTMDTELQKWASAIKTAGDDVERIFIFANNHFQGFAPGTINALRKFLGLDEIQLAGRGTSNGGRQETLF